EILLHFGLPVWSQGRLATWLRWLWPRRGTTILTKQTDSSVPPWVQSDFARRYSLQDRAIERLRPTYQRSEDAAVSVALSAMAGRAGDVLRWTVAAAHNIRIGHPYLDPRVFGLALGILARIPAQPCQQKPLLAAALHDVLPPEILSRR